MKSLLPFDSRKQQIVLFQKKFQNYTLKVKPFCLTRDTPVIHEWVNMEYTKRFWQMEGAYGKLYKHYDAFINSGTGYSIIFFMDKEPQQVALIDVYLAKRDEVAGHYDAGPEDFGIHLLMGPNKQRIPGLTTNVMVTGLSFLFTLGIQRIVGEPDVNNKNANALVQRVGFKWIKQITLSYKTANLYFCEKEEFLKLYPPG